MLRCHRGHLRAIVNHFPEIGECRRSGFIRNGCDWSNAFSCGGRRIAAMSIAFTGMVARKATLCRTLSLLHGRLSLPIRPFPPAHRRCRCSKSASGNTSPPIGQKRQLASRTSRKLFGPRWCHGQTVSSFFPSTL